MTERFGHWLRFASLQEGISTTARVRNGRTNYRQDERAEIMATCVAELFQKLFLEFLDSGYAGRTAPEISSQLGGHPVPAQHAEEGVDAAADGEAVLPAGSGKAK